MSRDPNKHTFSAQIEDPQAHLMDAALARGRMPMKNDPETAIYNLDVDRTIEVFEQDRSLLELCQYPEKDLPDQVKKMILHDISRASIDGRSLYNCLSSMGLNDSENLADRIYNIADGLVLDRPLCTADMASDISDAINRYILGEASEEDIGSKNYVTLPARKGKVPDIVLVDRIEERPRKPAQTDKGLVTGRYHIILAPEKGLRITSKSVPVLQDTLEKLSEYIRMSCQRMSALGIAPAISYFGMENGQMTLGKCKYMENQLTRDGKIIIRPIILHLYPSADLAKESLTDGQYKTSYTVKPNPSLLRKIFCAFSA